MVDSRNVCRYIQGIFHNGVGVMLKIEKRRFKKKKRFYKKYAETSVKNENTENCPKYGDLIINTEAWNVCKSKNLRLQESNIFYIFIFMASSDPVFFRFSDFFSDFTVHQLIKLVLPKLTYYFC